MPAAATITATTKMQLQASTAHADLVRTRIVLSLSFRGNQRRTLQARTPKATRRSGGKATYAGGTSGR